MATDDILADYRCPADGNLIGVISILLAIFGTAWFIGRAFALEMMQRIGL